MSVTSFPLSSKRATLTVTAWLVGLATANPTRRPASVSLSKGIVANCTSGDSRTPTTALMIPPCASRNVATPLRDPARAIPSSGKLNVGLASVWLAMSGVPSWAVRTRVPLIGADEVFTMVKTVVDPCPMTT